MISSLGSDTDPVDYYQGDGVTRTSQGKDYHDSPDFKVDTTEMKKNAKKFYGIDCNTGY